VGNRYVFCAQPSISHAPSKDIAVCTECLFAGDRWCAEDVDADVCFTEGACGNLFLGGRGSADKEHLSIFIFSHLLKEHTPLRIADSIPSNRSVIRREVENMLVENRGYGLTSGPSPANGEGNVEECDCPHNSSKILQQRLARATAVIRDDPQLQASTRPPNTSHLELLLCYHPSCRLTLVASSMLAQHLLHCRQSSVA
jgi:hypothetical protein